MSSDSIWHAGCNLLREVNTLRVRSVPGGHQMDRATVSQETVGQGFAGDGPWEPRRGRHALMVLILMGSLACGESQSTSPLPPGSMLLNIETSGFMKDDAYELLVDGASQGMVGANDEVTISGLDPATYQVDLGDVAANCVVEGISVPVVAEQTADASLSIVCAHPAPEVYTLRFSRERPNLDNGEITVCPFGLCPTEQGWDLHVYFNSQSDPHSVIRQNQSTGVEVAHLPGVVFEALTEQDFEAATFTTDLVGDSFDAGRVILIRTDLGNVYVLGNPVEDSVAQTLTFDVALIFAP